MTAYRYTSLTRIAPFVDRPFHIQPLGREAWASGDYVVCHVTDVGGFHHIERPDGRMAEIARGDVLVGALGRRHATLEATGTFEAVGPGGTLHLLTSAGLFGAETSRAPALPRLLTLAYRGHVLDGDRKATMRRYVRAPEAAPFATPTVLLVGTSMSAGKTTVGGLAVRQLVAGGRRVVGAKVTGAGRLRDILAFADAGAHAVYDFVDAGLPSTVVPEAEYAEALTDLLAFMSAAQGDVAVVEIGASPMEPYNAPAAFEALRAHAVVTLLAASDPYAAVGVMEAFGLRPDLICGRATNTIAGVELAQRLTGVPALDLTEGGTAAVVGQMIERRLDRLHRPGVGVATTARPAVPRQARSAPSGHPAGRDEPPSS